MVRLRRAQTGHKQTLSRTNCRLAQPPLFGQRHLELDARQLLGELADTFQERQPARVELDVGELVLGCNDHGRISIHGLD